MPWRRQRCVCRSVAGRNLMESFDVLWMCCFHGNSSCVNTHSNFFAISCLKFRVAIVCR